MRENDLHLTFFFFSEMRERTQSIRAKGSSILSEFTDFHSAVGPVLYWRQSTSDWFKL